MRIRKLFVRENYSFWKIRMKIFLESIYNRVWDDVINGPYIPMHTIMCRLKKTSTFGLRMRTRKCGIMLELDTSSPQHSQWRNSTKFLHARMQKK